MSYLKEDDMAHWWASNYVEDFFGIFEWKKLIFKFSKFSMVMELNIALKWDCFTFTTNRNVMATLSSVFQQSATKLENLENWVSDEWSVRYG